VVTVQMSSTRVASTPEAPSVPAVKAVWLLTVSSATPARARSPVAAVKATGYLPRPAARDGQDQSMPWTDRGDPHQLHRSRLDIPPSPGWNCGPADLGASGPPRDHGFGDEWRPGDQGLIGEETVVGLISFRPGDATCASWLKDTMSSG